MSYTKHNYQKGDELLASQLNDMDDQIALNEQTADTLVTVSNTQPSAAKNRVWVKATPSEIEIPTMEDHNELSRQISDVEKSIGENGLNNPTIVENYWIRYSDGEPVANSSYAYIQVSGISAYEVLHIKTNCPKGSTAIGFYNTNGTHVASVMTTSETSPYAFDSIVPIPNGADIVKVTCLKANIRTASVSTTIKEFLGALKNDVNSRIKNEDFSLLKTQFDSLSANDLRSIDYLSWEIGAINDTTGANVPTNSYIRTGFLDVGSLKEIVLSPNTGYKTRCFFYGQTKNYISATYIVAEKTRYVLSDDIVYLRFVMGKTNSDNPTVDESGNAGIFGNTIIQYELNNVTGIGEIPDYYFANDYLVDKTARINVLLNTYSANGTAFVFVTDEHFEHPRCNAQNSPALINYIYRNTHINTLIDGGDNADKSSVYWCDLLRKSWGGKIYHLIGNHDYMNGTAVREQELYAMCDMYNNDQIGVNDRHYYYVDNHQEKLRYIMLSSYKPSGSTSIVAAQVGLEQEQLTWLENVALDVQSGWGIIVFVHGIYGFNAGESGMGEGYYIPSSSNDQALLDVLEGYSGNGEIISVISGHQHLDRVIYTANANIPVIFTTCDANTVSRYVTADQRTTGTIGEQAFDVFVLDRVEKKWHIVRIGTKAYNGTGSTPGEAVEERTVSYGS